MKMRETSRAQDKKLAVNNNVSQVPFSSVNIGYVSNDYEAKVCEAFLLEYEKGLGKGEQPIFPNIIFRLKKGVNKNPEDKYYYLYELACRVAAKRMNPTFVNLDSKYYKPYTDRGVIASIMGCRTNVMANVNGPEGPVGRGNIAPVTINLPRLALKAMKMTNSKEKRIELFYKYLDEMLMACEENLMHRYDVLKQLKVKDLPFVAGQHLYVGSENLTDEDSIEPLLKQGTYGIGFIGLAETLIALIGEHHGESEEALYLGLDIIQYMKSFVNKMIEKYHLNFSLYATPAEGISGRFTPMDRKKFGIVKGITDKDYYTNSFHIPVDYPIDFDKKMKIEGMFHSYCTAGKITYIELDCYPDTETIKQIVDYMVDETDLDYIGINFHMRYCRDCGTYLEEHQDSCISCGSSNIQGISRVTGYLSLDERFGEGKSAERKDRHAHVGDKNVHYKVK